MISYCEAIFHPPYRWISLKKARRGVLFSAPNVRIMLNDILLTQYDIRLTPYDILASKHDIISVLSYAEDIYHPLKADIISKIYHPFLTERISLQKKHLLRQVLFCMAGIAGFEPTSDGVKVRCLTAWLYPNINKYRRH